MRRHPALLSSAAIAIVAAASLSGCVGDAVAACTPLVASGKGASLVTAEGPVGALPEVGFPSSITAATPERAVLTSGDGTVAQAGMTVDFDALVLDATSGRELLTTNFDGSQGVRYRAATQTAEGGSSSLADALVCAQPGQRLSLLTTVADTGLDFSTLGIAPESVVVFVVDVQSVFLGKADGINQLPLDGMPTVVTAPDGTVGISVPSAEAPSETRISTIKAGSGETIADGDKAVLQIASWAWPQLGAQPSKLQSTWDSVPVTSPIINDATGATGVTPGFFEAVVGSKVGSQILAVVAPADSHAPGSWPAGATEGTTIIYVIDVLGIQSPAE